MNGQCNRMNGASGLMDSWDILYRMLEHTARALRRLASSRSRSCLGKGKIAGVPGRFRPFVSLALSVLVHGLVLGISGHGLGAAFSSVASGMAPQALHAVLAGKPAELGEGNSPRPNTTEPASILPQKPKAYCGKCQRGEQADSAGFRVHACGNGLPGRWCDRLTAC